MPHGEALAIPEEVNLFQKIRANLLKGYSEQHQKRARHKKRVSENRFLFNGGVLTPFGFESSTSTIVLLQIIALKTTKSKFYVATPCTALISALGMVSIIVTKVPY